MTFRIYNPDIDLVGEAYRIRGSWSEGDSAFAAAGRLYKIERKNSAGEWEPLNRVQSFVFHADAKLGTYFEITQVEHDPSKV